MSVSAGHAVAGVRRSPVVDILGRAWYSAARLLVALALHVVFRLEVEGRENIPERGPVILASNHSSYLDPPVVGVGCPRKVYFMAKKELFSSRPIGALLGSLGGFAVARGSADRKALRTARRLLDDGEVLGIFPEGERGSGSPGKGEAGAAWLSIVTGSPVVPVAVIGTAGTMANGFLSFRPRRIKVRFGPPILPEDLSEGSCPDGRRPAAGNSRPRERMTLMVMREVSRLVGREEECSVL
ncbi:MAG: 1-acyl-sn-glycerol-3-phosphate acyltransferase [Actinobacteria bacterium]|nr:1-acyl-sn-glycerol-3-phosphate acyltransferase [Actinomycetota bacterium]MCG2817778.1 1-acyl-sn-glycerol-3-phosphate acyltransferase [Actinomycetes bacterium]MBU4179063.1 1-acyl-sn-glycerol-3-phosphate acyltransferase [Actinomycetota bacterium]MBU4218370.1 1-acyl-sn-glycerol-3-phosphate acyltransferase [Actinomycetota bacterium]MBU4359645.1 1-acyl-sn-glycerol-3-phosphate acyltransferase [Actinomycetota bacterium]